MIMPEQAAALVGELESVYDTILDQFPAAHRPNRIWEVGYCVVWSRRALPRAQQLLGTSATVHHVAYNPITTKPVTFHEYLVADLETTDPTIIDGTWQQFIEPEGRLSAPRILITPVSTIPEILAAHPPFIASYSAIWQPNLKHNTSAFRFAREQELNY